MKIIDGKLMNKISRLFRHLMAALALLPLLSTLSCSDSDRLEISDLREQTAVVSGLKEDISWANAIVTVRKSSSGRSYFQLDERVTLEPVDWENPFSNEVRALVAYSDLGQKSDLCTKTVSVERIDSLVTRDGAYIDMEDGLPGGSSVVPVYNVPTGFTSVSEMLEASSPIDVVTNEGVPDWMTFSEDGYLMIHFATFWGDVTKHSVNLYASRKHPDHLYLVHKDNGDYQSSWQESLVAFRICQLYLSRKDEYRHPGSVVLHWMSFGGEKTMRLRYGTRATER